MIKYIQLISSEATLTVNLFLNGLHSIVGISTYPFSTLGFHWYPCFRTSDIPRTVQLSSRSSGHHDLVSLTPPSTSSILISLSSPNVEYPSNILIWRHNSELIVSNSPHPNPPIWLLQVHHQVNICSFSFTIYLSLHIPMIRSRFRID